MVDVLRRRVGEFISGAELATLLGVSRTAVWKQIDGLKAVGYPVEARPGVGYRLLALPDIINAAEIQRGLATECFGRHVIYEPRVASTNAVVKQSARLSAPEGLLVISEEQVGGKGRLGRSWLSPPGLGVWMSLLLRPPLPPVAAPRLTLLAAVAVTEAIRAQTGLAAGIKWPNDIVYQDRKLCGILTELEAEWERVDFVVIGIGINVHHASADFPPQLQGAATSLAIETGRFVRRAGLIQDILARLEAGYHELLAAGFAGILARWRQYSATLGRQVRVLPQGLEQNEAVGQAESVDDEGALLVRLPTGRLLRVVAGEVSLRPE